MSGDLANQVRRIQADNAVYKTSGTGATKDDVVKMGMGGYNSSTGIFMGRDADTYKFSVGDPTGEYMAFDGSALVSTNMRQTTSLTLGANVEAGWLASVNASSGKAEPSRMNSVSSVNTTFGTTDTVTASLAIPMKSASMSDTVKVGVLCDANTTGSQVIKIYRHAFTPTTPTADTITNGTVFSSCYGKKVDMTKLSSTSVYVAGAPFVSSAEALQAKIVSGLDTTITVNSATTIFSGTAIAPQCAKYTATEVLHIYGKSSPTTSLFVKNATISGTTITAGSESTLLTTASAVTPVAIEQFGTTGYFAAVYGYGSNFYVSPFSYNGSTYTVGTEVSIAAYGSGNTGQLCQIDDTRLALIYNDGTNFKVCILSRTANTITVGTAVTVVAVGHVSAYPCITRISGSVVAVGVMGSTENEAYLFSYSGTTVALLGSGLATGGTKMGITLQKFNPTTLLCIECNSGTVTGRSLTCANNYSTFVGFFLADGSTDETGNVVVTGTYDITGLTTGTTYYRDCDEANTTTYNVSQGSTGIALSTSRLSIRIS